MAGPKLFWVSAVTLFALSLTLTPSTSISDVQLLLLKIKPSLQGFTENLLLLSWNISVPICQWRGLKWGFTNGSNLACFDLSSPHWNNASLYKNPFLQLVSLQLPSANLSGSIPKEIGELTNLRSLYLGVNSLSGSIPLELGYCSSLSDIDLSYNLLQGSLPTSMWNLCDRLVSLRLHGNSLSGSVPAPALPNSSCPNLKFLDLGHNLFIGNFPDFISGAGYSAIIELDLSDNMFSGQIPEAISQMNLQKLNLSHNNFTGPLPHFGESKFGVESFDANSPTLCGPPLKECHVATGLSSGAVAGLVIGSMTATVVLASLLIGYLQGRKRNNVDEEEDELVDEGDDEDSGEGKLVVFQGGEHLTLEDVLNATGQVTEKASYGTIYKAKLSDGGTITLRLLREDSCKDLSSCLPVIKQLGRIRHENLIPLRAFYQGKRGEKLLIYDHHLPNRTLFDLLHEQRAGKPVLNWGRRHKIALGIARGLAHLHGLESAVVHGNIRSRTILVDDLFVARLNELGVDKLTLPFIGDEILAQAKMDGYKAPELQSMKKSNPRSDVHAFGILLLEILLGKRPGRSSRNAEYIDLPSIVKTAVLEETTMEVFDVEILKSVRSPMDEGVVQALKLAMGCCTPVAAVRPSMDEVVRQLENMPRNRSALYSPAETRSGSVTPF